MSVIAGITSRNLKLFFRDKMSVFFSLLSVLILIVLYAMFLANMQYSQLIAKVGEVEGVYWMINTWIMAGMLSIVTLTSTLGAFSQFVGDKERESISDFMVSPVSDMQLILSYALCAAIVGIIVTTVATVMSALFLLIASGDPLAMGEMLKMSGILLLGVVMSTSIAMFIVSSLKTINSFATVSTIVGTLIGFLTGMYVPVGILPGIVQKIIYIFPVSHISMLLRQVLMDRPLQMVFANSLPEETAIYKTTYGVVYNLFGEGQAITTQQSLIYIVAVTLIFFALSLLTIRKNLKSA